MTACQRRGSSSYEIIHVCCCFPLAVRRKPQVIISCQPNVLMCLAFITELWLAVSRPHKSWHYMQSGSQALLSSVVVYHMLLMSPSTYDSIILLHTNVFRDISLHYRVFVCMSNVKNTARHFWQQCDLGIYFTLVFILSKCIPCITFRASCFIAALEVKQVHSLLWYFSVLFWLHLMTKIIMNLRFL